MTVATTAVNNNTIIVLIIVLVILSFVADSHDRNIATPYYAYWVISMVTLQ